MNEITEKEMQDFEKKRQIEDIVNLLFAAQSCIELASPVIYCGVFTSEENCKDCLLANLVRLFSCR